MKKPWVKSWFNYFKYMHYICKIMHYNRETGIFPQTLIVPSKSRIVASLVASGQKLLLLLPQGAFKHSFTQYCQLSHPEVSVTWCLLTSFFQSFQPHFTVFFRRRRQLNCQHVKNEFGHLITYLGHVENSSCPLVKIYGQTTVPLFKNNFHAQKYSSFTRTPAIVGIMVYVKVQMCIWEGIIYSLNIDVCARVWLYM